MKSEIDISAFFLRYKNLNGFKYIKASIRKVILLVYIVSLDQS